MVAPAIGCKSFILSSASGHSTYNFITHVTPPTAVLKFSANMFIVPDLSY